MELAARVDEYGKPAWIALTILAFIIFWPLGLALLAYVIWSGRMGCGKNRGRWHNMDGAGRRNWWKGDMRRASSGNAAFDEYREETLRRLEEEQDEFIAFLERLRKAKDKAEFDQFMDERRRNAGRASDHPASDKPAPENGNGNEAWGRA
ncbi:DUF2852 domain-containing protein [Rhodobium gokarnense]|uniref:DUF2852 domain-containing protein n=1 Tax=Rhodobium gokarnense TaxID=364296 RepID=A0ABT3H6L3_9HYPH|nr:DUF2852 domain-containing protein [Rhodobium gokarnense]MCW2306023.1 hypothetical protein [Rhodobium gokarnense]